VAVMRGRNRAGAFWHRAFLVFRMGIDYLCEITAQE